MKLLIGLYCNEKIQQTFAAKILRDELHLLAYNFKQPVLDAAAIIMGTSAYELGKHIPTPKKIFPWALTPAQIQLGLTKVMQAGNQNAFLEAGHLWLQNSRSSKLSEMFLGHLMCGISTENEAQFIREQGGLIVHVLGSEKPREINIAPDDVATYYVNKETPSQVSLITIARAYRQRIAQKNNSQAQEHSAEAA